MDDEQRYTRGLQVRREVLGNAHVERALEGRTAFTTDFQDFITRYAPRSTATRPRLARGRHREHRFAGVPATRNAR